MAYPGTHEAGEVLRGARRIGFRALDILGLWPFLGCLKGLYYCFSNLPVFYLVALTAFMFRPPDLEAPPVDRISFLLLLALTSLYFLLRREPLSFFAAPIFLPMAALATLAFCSIIGARFNIQTWSVFANKYIVPYAMFLIARMIFSDERAIRHFFVYCLIVLIYLTFTSIAFLVGAQFLIFPRYIVNANVGIMTDRARGPFLQAVANGTAINILALCTFHWLRKKRIHGMLLMPLLLAVPLAIVATMTRSVWLGFLASAAFLMASGRRKLGLFLVISSLAGLCAILMYHGMEKLLVERLQEKGPIDFRFAIYKAGWEMFLDKPCLGWGVNGMSLNIWRYVVGYTTKYDWASHNTYLEVLVDLGIVGIILYGLMFFCLFRLGGRLRQLKSANRVGLIDGRFVVIFRLILVVYLMNGMFVVMNYQFVNALLFMIAGIVWAADLRAKRAALP
jgi:O-antigen ligase